MKHANWRTLKNWFQKLLSFATPMPDYSQGKIYIITANGAEEGDVYVGSTTDKLYNRLAKHKHRQSCNVKILKSIKNY